MEIQYYAINTSYPLNAKGRWTVLESRIPCEAGQGKVVTQNLTEIEMMDLLGQSSSLSEILAEGAIATEMTPNCPEHPESNPLGHY